MLRSPRSSSALSAIGCAFFLVAASGCKSPPNDAAPVSTTHPTANASGTSTGFGARPDAGPPKGTPAALIADRPYRLRVPHGADAGTPLSLVLMLHGFGSNSVQIERQSGLDTVADANNLAIAAPDGTPDSGGRRFWNATDSCCDFDDHKVDDVAYLTAVIDDALKKTGADRNHVYVMGHSNGGFMALRLACDISPKIAAIVTMAGAGYADPTRCKPTTKVSVLDIHGDADRTIPYTGGMSPRLPEGTPFASAQDTVNAWGTYDSCKGPLRSTGKLDVTDDIPASESDKSVVQGCPSGTEVELWTVKGADHTFGLTPAAISGITAFLAANPKS